MTCQWVYSREKELTVADFVISHAFTVRKFKENWTVIQVLERSIFKVLLIKNKTIPPLPSRMATYSSNNKINKIGKVQISPFVPTK